MIAPEDVRNSAPPLLRVTFPGASGEPKTASFQQPFQIGRTGTEVAIANEFVSRHHASVSFEDGRWWVRDLNSSNGIFVNGERHPAAPVDGSLSIRLGVQGPVVSFQTESPKPRPAPVPPPEPPAPKPASDGNVNPDIDQYIAHYFAGDSSGAPAGEHTLLVRKAFSKVRTKQRWRYAWVIAILALGVGAAGYYAYREHAEAAKQRQVAATIFYSMKSLDLDIANVERIVLDSNGAQDVQQIAAYQRRRREMERNYDEFLSNLKVYDPKMTPQDRVVMRIARIFGECEIEMPPEFRTEIDRYIKLWQSSGRLKNAIARARDNAYTATIVQEFLAQDLPPQFFYLALQESDFNPFISGPPTRKGIAKGMWQFIPETGSKYGLHIGPLADLPRPDPGDDRHHWALETKAAARYIKDLYSTDAQASGFLVMACYNWGENQVLPLVRSLPYNPKERNFWKLLTAHRDKIPQETYDYVFYIASAAAIGEDPRLFGFDFDNPLGSGSH